MRGKFSIGSLVRGKASAEIPGLDYKPWDNDWEWLGRKTFKEVELQDYTFRVTVTELETLGPRGLLLDILY